MPMLVDYITSFTSLFRFSFLLTKTRYSPTPHNLVVVPRSKAQASPSLLRFKTSELAKPTSPLSNMNPHLSMKMLTPTPCDLHAPPPPSPEMKEAVVAVEMIVGYAFKNKRLLEEALTHPSHPDAVSYQRLEFVGDAVLSLAVSNYLFLAYPRIDQGNLSLLRSANVSTEKLARVAVRHRLFRFLRHSAPVLSDKVREFTEVVSGEEETPLVYRGSVKAPKVLADIVESVAAAIYVDLNFDLEKLWMTFRHVLEPIVTLKDLQQQPQPVTKLFEICQKHGKHVDIKYWRDEMKSIASVYVDGKFVASGASEQKEVAKVNAAEIALYKLLKLMRIDDVASIRVIAGIDGSFHIEGAKHKLHELCGKKKWPRPVYNIKQDEGSSHEKKFVSTVQIATIDGMLCMTGDEMSRVKDADNSAASLMIRTLQESDYV